RRSTCHGGWRSKGQPGAAFLWCKGDRDNARLSWSEGETRASRRSAGVLLGKIGQPVEIAGSVIVEDAGAWRQTQCQTVQRIAREITIRQRDGLRSWSGPEQLRRRRRRRGRGRAAADKLHRESQQSWRKSDRLLAGSKIPHRQAQASGVSRIVEARATTGFGVHCIG